jgi:hypothetical protein
MPVVEADMGRYGVTMRELQKMSAATLKALPHSVPVKNGDETVAVLAPLKKYDPEKWDAVFKRIDANNARLPPEIRERIERMLGERED